MAPNGLLSWTRVRYEPLLLSKSLLRLANAVGSISTISFLLLANVTLKPNLNLPTLTTSVPLILNSQPLLRIFPTLVQERDGKPEEEGMFTLVIKSLDVIWV